MDETVIPDVDVLMSFVSQIVEKPEEAKAERLVDEMGVLITLQVAQEDMGKVVGKDGQTAKALRTLLKAIGAKYKARISLKIVEPNAF